MLRPVSPPPKTTTSPMSRPAGARRLAHSRAAPGEAISTSRSPASMASLPRGMITAVGADDRRHDALRRDPGVRQRAADEPAGIGGVDGELDHLDAATREDIGLQRIRVADRAGDCLRSLLFGGDDEVDVEVAGAPGIEVLRRPGANDDLAAADRTDQHRGNDVRLVAVGGRDDEVGDAGPGTQQVGARGAAPLHGQDVEPVGDRGEAVRIELEHGDVVRAVQRRDDGRADLAGADDEYLHGARAYRTWHGRYALGDS